MQEELPPHTVCTSTGYFIENVIKEVTSLPVYDAGDMIDARNRKRRRQKFLRFVLIILLVSACIGLYKTRNMWLSKIRGIGKQYSTIVNSGKLAEGNFPILISSEENFQIDYTGNCLAVLTDVQIFFYTDDGSLLKKRQHGFSSPIMRTSSEKVLLYENGGKNLCVETDEDTVYSKEFEQNILFARISDEGYVAVVTTSENYECEMYIYDKKGSSIYERKCVERVSDVSFTNESKGCTISCIDAEKGSIVTSVQSLDFKESKALWSSPGIDTFGFDIYGFDSGAFVLGIDACGYVNGEGQICSYYKYDGELAGGSSKNGKSAVAVNNEDRRKYSVTLFDGGNTEPVVINMATPVSDVIVFDGLAYVMCQEEILAYEFNGTLRSTAVISDSYTGFARSSEYIFLKGHSQIDRIDYES